MTSLWLDRATSIASDPFPLDARVDDVVVGAGLTGLVTGVLLARAGRSVVVVEARSVGAVTTGNTTAKLSLLQGTQLSSILANHSPRVARAYVEANRAGQQWLIDYCAAHGISVQRRDAYTYAGTRKGAIAVRAELTAARIAGLDVSHETELDLPYPTHGAVKLADQYQFDPVEVLRALAGELRASGGTLVEGVRVLGVDAAATTTLKTTAGALMSETVVLASGVPILDRGLYFTKVAAMRSYATAFSVPAAIPADMYLSTDNPSRSLRTAGHGTRELLLVGGNAHPVGRKTQARAQLDDLVDWTKTRFPGAELTHTWSAQDYVSHNHVPFVGKLPRGRGHVYLATGYSKWGMTNAPAAGITLAASILDHKRPRWSTTLGRRVSGPVTALTGARANAAVGFQAATGWARGVSTRLEARRIPEEGTGTVGRRGIAPVATSTVDGATCSVSAVCPHLGGIVTWNDAERSWDCPLHGSRFAPNGDVLEGPAVKGLAR